jgi:pilus assembly protein CpaB
MTSRFLASQNEKVTVLVAKQKITSGSVFKEPEQLFDMEERLRSDVPKNAVVSTDALKDQALKSALEKGDILVADNLVDKNKLGIEISIPPGFRAVGVKTTPEAIVGGFVLPGSHVDVIHTARGKQEDIKGQMILQNILVLAVDTIDTRQEGRAVLSTTVSLLVTPEEATVLAAAQNTGIISFSLRSKQDETVVDRKSKKEEPLPEPKTEPVEPTPGEPAKAPSAKVHTLIIINGPTQTKTTFTHDANGDTQTSTEQIGSEPAPSSPSSSLPPAPPPAKDNEAGNK